MKETLEKLWNDYLLDECSAIDTTGERSLTEKAAELHKIINDCLNSEQQITLESFVDALCDTQSLFAKKAFFKGCEFALLFFLEATNQKG